GGLMGPVANAATPAAGESGTGTSARPAAAPAGVPVPVLSRLTAAQDAGDDGVPEAAHATATAAGAEAALAVFDPRPAGPAAPHGLDRLGERLADPRTRLGLSAWLLSGAAALAVVELNRRRRAAAADGAGEVPLTWPGLPGPAPEPAS